MILLEHGHARAGFNGYITGAGLQLTRKNLQEGGLARAVCTKNNAIAVALGELHVYILKSASPVKFTLHIGNGNHIASINKNFQSSLL